MVETVKPERVGQCWSHIALRAFIARQLLFAALSIALFAFLVRLPVAVVIAIGAPAMAGLTAIDPVVWKVLKARCPDGQRPPAHRAMSHRAARQAAISLGLKPLPIDLLFAATIAVVLVTVAAAGNRVNAFP